MSVYGVLLHEEAYALLGAAIEPYVQTGSIGKFLYCSMAQQNGSFMDLTFEPSQTNGSVSSRMIVSIPVGLVKFMATGADVNAIGFNNHK